MEEERVKSALEIAMERISGLPELTPEEIAEQKEKEYRPVGQALAGRYMRDIIDRQEIPAELSRHEGDSEPIVRRAFISSLCGFIQLEDSQMTVKALSGLCSLAGEEEGVRKKANTSWTRLLDSYQKQRNKAFQECEASEKEKLAVLGISGSAVRPNLTENESLRKRLQQLHRSFEPELEKLRAMFLGKLQAE